MLRSASFDICTNSHFSAFFCRFRRSTKSFLMSKYVVLDALTVAGVWETSATIEQVYSLFTSIVLVNYPVSRIFYLIKTGAIGLAVGHPMDTIKTIQQMDNRTLSSAKVIAQIMRTEGVTGFYKGMLFPLVSAGTLNSVFFGVYGNSLRALQVSRGYDPGDIIPEGITVYHDTFIAGSIGGVVQATMACPSEFIKVRMQTNQEYFGFEERTFARSRKPGDVSTYRITVDAYRSFGIRGLYTGFVPMLWRDVSASGLYVLAYLYIRHHVHGHLELHPGPFDTLVAGGIAGFVSWLPVIPLDTIKSRMQADNLRAPTYTGMIDCGVKLFRVGGIHILFKGFGMIALRSFPVNASAFLSYDTMMQCLKRFRGSSKR